MNPSLALLPCAYDTGKLYSVLPEDGTGDFTVLRNGTGTYLGKDGLLKTAQANEPRLEFNPDGTFKGVLVEPASTNLLIRSEEFENASWVKSSGLLITPNSLISPNGTLTADTFTPVASAVSSVSRTLTSPIGLITMSVWAKVASGTKQFRFFRFNGIDSLVSSGAFVATTIWQRFTWTTSPTVSDSSWYISNFTAESSEMFIWGAQLEVGSVATSYIPTVASQVTRPADVISRTGIADLIGQTEGSVYVECNKQMDLTLERIFSIYSTSNPSFDNISLSKTSDNNIILAVRKNNNLSSYIFFGFTGIIKKIAFAYSKEINGIVLYLNGSQVILQTNSADFSSTLEEIYLGMIRPSITTANIFNGEFKKSLIFKTRLTNAQLQALTTL